MKDCRIMLVVAGALIDPHGQVLVAQRAPGKTHGGLWEFPGGKVEAGETLVESLARELREELCIAIDRAAVSPVGFTSRMGGHGELVLLLFAIRGWQGAPVAREHEALAWHAIDMLAGLSMPPADRALLLMLDRYLAAR